MKRSAANAGLAVACCVLSACVSLKRTPEARFFVLRSVAEPDAVSPTGSAAVIGVDRVIVPGHLDRPQIVTAAGPNEVEIDEYARWAEPLGTGVARVVAENLSARLPKHRVVRYPWSASTDLRCRVALELEAFGPSTDGQVRLEGRWSLLSDEDDRSLASRPFALVGGPVSNADPRQGVATMSELLSQLSEQLAAAIRELPPKTRNDSHRRTSTEFARVQIGNPLPFSFDPRRPLPQAKR